MSDWAGKWPAEPRGPHPEVGDRVIFGKHRGTVIDAWRSPRGFEREGEWHVRVQLDRGAKVTCKAHQLRLKSRRPRALPSDEGREEFATPPSRQ